MALQSHLIKVSGNFPVEVGLDMKRVEVRPPFPVTQYTLHSTQYAELKINTVNTPPNSIGKYISKRHPRYGVRRALTP